MAKGRLVLDVWKDQSADPFFWIALEGEKDYKVFYGREGWTVDLSRKETRAKYAQDNEMTDPDASQIIASIDIAGPMEEIIKLIEFAGYHGCVGPAKPRYLYAPKKSVVEISEHLATLNLIQELAKNDPKASMHYYRSHPLERATKYDQGAYRGQWSVVTGKHQIINAEYSADDSVKTIEVLPQLLS